MIPQSKNYTGANTRIKKRVIHYFAKSGELSKEELVQAIVSDFPHWSKATINIRISELKKEGIIKNPSRGLYSLHAKEKFNPAVSPSLRRLHNKVHQAFPFITFCVWESKWLNDLMRHQAFRFYSVIEVEKEVAESVFNAMSGFSQKTFLDPDEEIFSRYVTNLENAIIIKPLVSESPLEVINKVSIPSLEKLLVDMLIDEDLFAAQQGEKEFIYRSAFNKYGLSQQKMKRYASRRHRDKELDKLLNKVLPED